MLVLKTRTLSSRSYVLTTKKVLWFGSKYHSGAKTVVRIDHTSLTESVYAIEAKHIRWYAASFGESIDLLLSNLSPHVAGQPRE